MQNIRHACSAFLAGLILSLSYSPSYAAGINSISGTPSDGGQITINGSGFTSKANAKPLYFLDFSGGSYVNSPYARSAYNDIIRGTVTTSASKAPGSKSALQAEVGGIDTPAALQNGVQFSSSNAYFWVKRSYGFDISTDGGTNGFNLKTTRLWDTSFKHDTFIGWQGSEGVGSGRIAVDFTTPSGLYFSGVQQVKNQWLIEEYDYAANSALGVTDGIFNYTRNGVSAYSADKRWCFTNSQYPNAYTQFFLDQVSNNTISSGRFIYYDAIYVDDTRHRVIISDEPTWQVTTSTAKTYTREIQLPVAWSDSQIQIVVRQGSLASLAGKYLYVINSSGTPVSTTGFPLCSSNCPKTPKAPDNFSVL